MAIAIEVEGDAILGEMGERFRDSAVVSDEPTVEVTET
jgi:hypothetical protein